MPSVAIIALAAMAAAIPRPIVDAKGIANARGEAELARVIGARQPGRPVDCISPLDQDSVRVIEGTAIVYGDGARLYVNRLMDGADTLRRDDVLVVHVHGGQLCRLDAVTLLAPPSRIPRGFVTLGPFTPYSRPR